MLEYIKQNPVVIYYTIILIASIATTIITAVRRKGKHTDVEVNLINEIMDNMIKAEEKWTPQLKQFGIDIGSNKLDEVISKMQNYCLSNQLVYDKDKILKYIDELINFSKNINYKGDK